MRIWWEAASILELSTEPDLNKKAMMKAEGREKKQRLQLYREGPPLRFLDLVLVLVVPVVLLADSAVRSWLLECGLEEGPL